MGTSLLFRSVGIVVFMPVVIEMISFTPCTDENDLLAIWVQIIPALVRMLRIG